MSYLYTFTDDYLSDVCNSVSLLILTLTNLGYASVRSGKFGSWFIQQLCVTLQDYAENCSLEEMCIIVRNKVCAMEMPEDPSYSQLTHKSDTLTKKLFFKVKKPYVSGLSE